MITVQNYDLDHLEKCIEELENTHKNLKDGMKTDFGSQLFLLKLKHEKLRAMAAVMRSQSILANMDILLAQTELRMNVKDLKCNSYQLSKVTKKKLTDNDERSSKKTKLISEKETEDTNSTSSNKSNKENATRAPSKRKRATKPKESQPSNAVCLQVSDNTANPTPPTIIPSLKCSIPLQNLSNRPVFGKKTIFLENPPIKDTKIRKNEGYYSSAHANQILGFLGYNPNSLPLKSTPGSNTMDCRGSFAVNSTVSAKDHSRKIQVSRAYNLSVAPGYNLSVTPGYVMQNQVGVQSESTEINKPKVELSNSRIPTQNISSTTNQVDTSKSDDEMNGDIKSTNRLFREIMNTKNVDVKDEEIKSIASIDTIVIATKLETSF